MEILLSILLVLEMCLILVYILSIILFWIILFRRRMIFHVNLLLLLATIPFSGIIILVPRPLVEYLEMSGADRNSFLFKFISWLHGTGLFANALDLFNFVAERLVATVFLSSYEKVHRPTLTTVLLFWQWLSSALLVAWSEFGNEELATMVLVVICGCCILLSTAMFAVLPRIALRAHDRVAREVGLNNLSKRYQSVENVRSARMLNRLIIFMVVALTLLLALFSYTRFKVSIQERVLYFRGFYCLEAIHLTTALVLVILSHPRLIEEACHFFGIPAPKTTGVVSLSGTQLNIGVQQHRDVYFSSYAKSWNTSSAT